ncbi:MAG: tellurite resistance TerB family protein [Deltaproteobacteria bacterium]
MSGERTDRLGKLRELTHGLLEDPAEDAETAGMVETAFLMAAADGHFGNAEQDEFAEALQFLSSGKLTLEQVDAVLDELIDALREDGWDKRIEAVTAKLATPESRRNAYRLAAGISFVDGQVQDEEAHLFGLLGESFGIPTDEASKLLVGVRDVLFPQT